VYAGFFWCFIPIRCIHVVGEQVLMRIDESLRSFFLKQFHEHATPEQIDRCVAIVLRVLGLEV
jgi:hypothetical protein